MFAKCHLKSMSQGCNGFQAELEYRTDEWLAKVLRAAGLGHRVVCRKICVSSDNIGVFWWEQLTMTPVSQGMRLMLSRNALLLRRQLKEEDAT
jgi:hypothetical protein